MAVTSTRFGQRTYSAWQVHEAWRARRREMTESYRAEASTAQSGLAAAWSNQIEGTASLAAKAAIARIKAETQAVAKTAASIKISV
jgi:hypothetical protein